MRQEINLLSAQLQPPAQWLSLNALLRVVGGVAVVLAMTSGVEFARSRAAAGELAQLQHDTAQTSARNEAERAARDNDPATAALKSDLAALTAEQRGNAQLLAAVTDRNLTNSRGFAPYFEALARHHRDGLWLSRVAIDAETGSIDLAGHALEADLVPAWLQQLRDTAVFAQSVFSSLTVAAAEATARDDAVGFSVRGRQ